MKSTATAMAAIALALTLAGCGGAPKTDAERQATVNAITASYTVAKATAVLYSALPPCTDAVANQVCANPAIVREIGKALVIADVAVAEAKRQILTSTDQSTAEKWAGYALAAIDVLAKALATYGVRTG